MTRCTKAHERVLSFQRANFFHGFHAVPGQLTVTNERLLFMPLRFAHRQYVFDIPFGKIREAKASNTLGFIPTSMRVYEKDGSEYKFVVLKREKMLRLINKSIK
ncbi:MAG: hypothetical protein HY832_00850 [Candidatus Aenigmarchaeota archaeon]|nr:hypothetical protein [Candidatus Aenigmarchaeota archaeon]